MGGQCWRVGEDSVAVNVLLLSLIHVYVPPGLKPDRAAEGADGPAEGYDCHDAVSFGRCHLYGSFSHSLVLTLSHIHTECFSLTTHSTGSQ